MRDLPENPDFDELQRKAALDYNLHLLGDETLKEAVTELGQRGAEFWEELVAIEEQGNRSLTCAEFGRAMRSFVTMTSLRSQINTRLDHDITSGILESGLAGLKADLAKLLIISKLLDVEELLDALKNLDPSLHDFAESHRQRFRDSGES